MTAFEIPTQPAPQKYTVTLNGNDYRITQRWNVFAACWVLDIADTNETLILSGIPLVTGADLFEQFEYMGLGGELIVQTDHNQDGVPTYDNLGSTGHLFYVRP